MAIVIAPEPSPVDIRRRRIARYMLWRLGGWGGAAVLALTALAITSQTEIGSQRLQVAIANATEPVRAAAVAQIPPRSLETEAETQRLAAQVRVLAVDRERLTARITTLEHNLDGMTGTIKQQANQAAAPAPSAPAAAPPVITAPPVIAPLAMPAPTETLARWSDTPQTQAAAPASEHIPLPPIRMAAASAGDTPAEPAAKCEFGIDLGGASNVEALRAHWMAVKANFGPLLVGLRPVASPHQRPPGDVI